MKYAHITTGTTDFLQKLVTKYPQFTFTMMRNPQTTAVYYESPKKRSVFAAGTSFSIVKEYLPIPDEGYVVSQYIPVAKDAKKVFLEKLHTAFDKFTLANGLIAARVLETKKGDAFQLLMVWNQESDYDQWQKTKNEITDFTHLVRQPSYFAERTYTNTYHIIQEDENK